MFTLKITYLKNNSLQVFEKSFSCRDTAYLASFEVSELLGFSNVKSVKVSAKSEQAA